MGSTSRVLWAGEAAKKARRFLEDYERRLSRFRPDSELSALNRDRRSAVPASPLLRAAVRAAVWAAERTGGLVDPTLLPALRRAGYAASLVDRPAASLVLALAAAPPRHPAMPDPACRWREITVEDEAALIHRPPGIEIDNGGTGKGLAADAVAHRLRRHDRFVVDCGGDIRVGGRKARVQPYEIEVEHPLTGETVRTLMIGDGGVATSGLGRRLWRTQPGATRTISSIPPPVARRGPDWSAPRRWRRRHSRLNPSPKRRCSRGPPSGRPCSGRTVACCSWRTASALGGQLLRERMRVRIPRAPHQGSCISARLVAGHPGLRGRRLRPRQPSVGVGLAMAGGVGRRPGGQATLIALHEQAAIAGLDAVAVHGLTLLGDPWLRPGLTGTGPVRRRTGPVFTGLGIVGGYLAPRSGSFYLRRRIGARVWRSLTASRSPSRAGPGPQVGAGTDAASPGWADDDRHGVWCLAALPHPDHARRAKGEAAAPAPADPATVARARPQEAG